MQFTVLENYQKNQQLNQRFENQAKIPKLISILGAKIQKNRMKE